MFKHPRPLALIILDGWGYREEKDANAIAAAHIPHWDNLWDKYAHTLISGSGKCVGLPYDQMGNSEVGHLNMGAGRVVHQDLTRIDLAIEDGSFFSDSLLTSTIANAIKADKSIHILGLLSPGGVHSHEKHLHALLRLAALQGAKKVFLHAFLDGRDTPPRSAEASLTKTALLCQQLNCGKIASIVGRYYAMDRDQRWDRVEKAYDLLTRGEGEYEAPDPITALQMAYERGESDEFVKPTAIFSDKNSRVTIHDGDTIIFMNFRADRAREITHAFIDDNFLGFKRKQHPKLETFVTLTEYDSRFKVPVVFPPERLSNILGEYLSQLGLHQLRIAETEKYAHVTFFFNGGIETPYPHEERILIASPLVATYDLQPEMSAPALADRLVAEIKSKKYDVIICNFANADMVGHTGNFAATITAIETLDACLKKITDALLDVGGEALITADHGNAEMMHDNKTGQAHTAHTSEPVPLIYVGRDAKITKSHGILADIAPTLLYLLGIPKPPEMTGTSLLELN